MPTTLETNLALCLEACRYAKGHAPSSANQTYYKRGSPMKDRVRNMFLLGHTRGTKWSVERDEDGNMITATKDPIRVQRRQQVENLIAGPLSKQEKARQLDEWINAWGKNYFFNSADRDEINEQKKRNVGGNPYWDRVVKMTGYSIQELRDMGEEKRIWVMQYSSMKEDTRSTPKSGVGNCDEKAQLAAEYLVEHNARAGVHLACCFLSPRHKGVTGFLNVIKDRKMSSGGGDHVFLVYDMENAGRSVSEWGENAIIVDGWMNDAYPAKKYLQWKYGRTYKGERINIAQFNIRNMICVSYRNHIDTRFRWPLEVGGLAI